MDLKKLAKDKGTNLKQIAEKYGIPPTTLYSIASGDTKLGNVGIDIAIKVADALDMTVEELYTGEKKEFSSITLDSDERELIQLYRKMNDAQRELLMSTAHQFSMTNKKR